MSGVSTPSPSNANPIGVGIFAGGTSGMEGEALPLFQNAVRSGRGFTNASGGAYVPLTSDGWPDGTIASVQCILYTANPDIAYGYQYWFYDFINSQYRTFKGGFLGNGSETVTGQGANATITSQVGALTTFDFVPVFTGATLFAFTISGISVPVTNIYCNLPDYPGADPTQLLFTNEAIAYHSQWAHLRAMHLQVGWNNINPNTSATRNTSANTKARKNWYSGGSNGFEGYPSDWFMQLAAQCPVQPNGTNTGVYLIIPAVDDGTYAAAVLTDAANIVPPGKKIYFEFGNELWNGTGSAGLAFQKAANTAGTDFQNAQFTGTISGTTLTVSSVTGTIVVGDTVYGPGVNPEKINSGSGTTWVIAGGAQTVGPVAMSTSNAANLYAYVGQRCHDLATQARSIFGATRFLNDVRILFAVQVDGNGLTFCEAGFNYMASKGYTPSDDIYAVAFAPYMAGSKAIYRSTFTPAISSGSNILTASSTAGSTGAITGVITAGDLVFHPNIPQGTTILAYGTSGTTGVGAAGTYALSANATGTVPGASAYFVMGSNPTAPTTAQLIANVDGSDGLGNPRTNSTTYQFCLTEKMSVFAKFWGLRGGLGTYENGWAFDTEIWNPNMGAAVLDLLSEALERNYYKFGMDFGINFFTRLEGGVTGARQLYGFGPNNALDNSASNLLNNNSPRMKAARDMFDGTYIRQRNAVNGPGSSFSATNWIDNVDGVTFPVMDTTQKIPPRYNINGQLSYNINCITAGTYNLVVTFKNTSATAKVTNVVIDGVTLYTGISIPGSGVNSGINDVALGAIPLTVGTHALFLGDNVGSQLNVSVIDRAGPINGIRWN